MATNKKQKRRIDYDKEYSFKIKQPVGFKSYVRVLKIIKTVKKIKVKDILIIGCGRGILDIKLAKEGYNITSFDSSKTAIEYLKKRVKDEGISINAFQADLTKLNLNKKFDLVIASEVIEHIEDDIGAVDVIKKLIRPSKYFLMTVPYNPKLWNALEDSDHYRRYLIKDIERLLQGFKILKKEVFGFPIMRIYRYFYEKTYQPKENKTINESVYIPKGGMLRIYKRLFPLMIKIFQIDDLFNFTKKGMTILVLAKLKKDDS